MKLSNLPAPKSKEAGFESGPGIPVAIVDDDENDRLLMRRILHRTTQFQCVGSYSSGRDALAGIPSLNCAVVLMDIRMPGMSGLECTRRLKAMLPGLAVVIVTMLDGVTLDVRSPGNRGR